MKKTVVRLFPGFVFWIISWPSATFADAYYSLTALSTPQSPISFLDQPALNDNGQVVGFMPAGPNWQQGYGFVYNGAPGGDGGVTPLGGSTAPTNYPAVRDSHPYAISDSGQILGSTEFRSGSDYVYSNGQETTLPMAPAGFNNAGQVMGMSFRVASDGTVSPVVYNLSTGTQQNIPAVPGTFQTLAVAINGSGQVAGNTFYQSSYNPAYPGTQGSGFLYSNGTTTALGTLGGSWTTVNAINSSGAVTGSSALSSNLIGHAFLYANGAMTDLGTLPGYQTSVGNGINAQGQVVGFVGNGSNIGPGFLYSNGVMTNLNSLISPGSGWTILSGLSINNLGQILAMGVNSSLSPSGGPGDGYVLLTPADLAAPGDPSYPTIVPEPGSLALYSLMATAVVVRRRARRTKHRGRPRTGAGA